ncbi:MAG: methyl-coenzyme M reductase-associated protein Mmp3 [Candidatus Syntropharchaeia archaeon]
MIDICIDGIKISAKRGTLLRSLIEEMKKEIRDDVLVVRRERETKIREGRYIFETEKGRFVVEISWKGYDAWKGVGVNWSDPKRVVFGPAEFGDEKYVRREVKRKKGDIFLFRTSSTSPDTYLGISLADHEEISFVPEAVENGVIGKISAGFLVAEKLSRDDKIKEILPDYRTESIVKKLPLNAPINEEMEIFTRMRIKLSSDSPSSVESFFTYLKNKGGVFEVDESTYTYVHSENPIYFDIPPENNTSFRERGGVFIRNEGERKNSIYIYKESRMPQSSLNKIGEVVEGIELAEIAKKGDKILIQTEPSPVFVIGMTQRDAEEYLKNLNILQERIGNTDDNSIVVAQYPPNSLGIHSSGKVKTEGVDPDDLLYIEFFEEEAPETVEYVRNVTELYKNYPIGKFEVLVSTDSLVLFKGKGKKEVIREHENLPEGRVEPGILGMTNMSRPQYGILGVRFTPSDEFGPTGEPFESTNIFGRVVRGLDKLKDKKKVAWFKDVTKRSGPAEI